MVANIVEAEAWGLEQYARGRDNAGLLMTDFCAAFPSLATQWLLHVLTRMGISSAVIRFFTLLYQAQYATIVLGGKRHGQISMGRGVKQGCPSSMLLFVLAADPLLRWVQASLASHISRSLAYADDFCFGLPDILTSLGPVFHKLEGLERIAGLRLNYHKCQLLLVVNLEISRVRSSIKALKGDIKHLQVLRCVKYLGMCIGPLGSSAVWTEALRKFRLRVGASRHLGLGLTRAAVAFR
eukprot:9177055-Pyramimonas_sp.AAC.1